MVLLRSEPRPDLGGTAGGTAGVAARSPAEAPLTEEIPAGGCSPLPGTRTGEREASDSFPPSFRGWDLWDVWEEGASYLLVRAVSRQTAAPVEGVRVGLFREGSGGKEEKTGPTGLAVLEAVQNVPLHFWVQPPKKPGIPDGGRRFFQDLDPLARGEERRVVVELPFPFDRGIAGREVAVAAGEQKEIVFEGGN